jgi:hypothetical protein
LDFVWRLRSTKAVLLGILSGINVKDQMSEDLSISSRPRSYRSHLIFIIIHSIILAHGIDILRVSLAQLARGAA